MILAGARSGLNTGLGVSTGGQESVSTGLCGEYGRALTSFQRQMAERRPHVGDQRKPASGGADDRAAVRTSR